jgi:hypothetical protein
VGQRYGRRLTPVVEDNPGAQRRRAPCLSRDDAQRSPPPTPKTGRSPELVQAQVRPASGSICRSNVARNVSRAFLVVARESCVECIVYAAIRAREAALSGGVVARVVGGDRHAPDDEPRIPATGVARNAARARVLISKRSTHSHPVTDRNGVPSGRTGDTPCDIGHLVTPVRVGRRIMRRPIRRQTWRPYACREWPRHGLLRAFDAAVSKAGLALIKWTDRPRLRATDFQWPCGGALTRRAAWLRALAIPVASCEAGVSRPQGSPSRRSVPVSWQLPRAKSRVEPASALPRPAPPHGPSASLTGLGLARTAVSPWLARPPGSMPAPLAWRGRRRVPAGAVSACGRLPLGSEGREPLPQSPVPPAVGAQAVPVTEPAAVGGSR